MRKDYSASIIKANVYGFIATLPSILVIVKVSTYIWKWESDFDYLLSLSFQNILFLIFVLSIQYILHVLIQGQAWQFFGNKTANDIEYIINRSDRAFYVYCKELIELKTYRSGIAMPFMILGILPTILRLLISNSFIFLFGLSGILFANEDIAVMWLIRNVKSGSLVEDHPKRAGCYIIDKNEA